MKSLILTALLFVSMTVFSQKIYDFDYIIEYDFYWDHRTPKPTKYIYLTNSQNNAYTAVLTEKDSVTLKLDVLDHKGNHAIHFLSKEQFAESINFKMKCHDVKPHSNTKKSLLRRFDFKVLEDTLIRGDAFGHYILKSKKNDDSAVEHYIIDKSLDEHLPILRFATAFGKWELSKNLPNGILLEKYLMDIKGKKRHKLVLKKYSEINKTISIPEDCDYSK